MLVHRRASSLMRAVWGLVLLAMSACGPTGTASSTDPEANRETAFAEILAIETQARADRRAGRPDYVMVDTKLLDDDLVNFVVIMRRARTKADVEDYAECAAAQYALIRGYGFARHIRTAVGQNGPIWQGDAVYVISAALPAGVDTIDAEVTVARCQDEGIPTV